MEASLTSGLPDLHKIKRLLLYHDQEQTLMPFLQDINETKIFYMDTKTTEEPEAALLCS